MESPTNYLDFKIKMIEKTYDLYMIRMDIWEEWFFKVKYGCITMIVVLLGFKYTYAKSEIFLNLIALAATLGLWLFEGVLRTTFYRYMARLDVLTDTINNREIMEKVFSSKQNERMQIDRIQVLDFNVSSGRLEEIVKKAFEGIEGIDWKKKFDDKKELTKTWNSMKIKNLKFFYGMLIIFQLLALIFFQAL